MVTVFTLLHQNAFLPQIWLIAIIVQFLLTCLLWQLAFMADKVEFQWQNAVVTNVFCFVLFHCMQLRSSSTFRQQPQEIMILQSPGCLRQAMNETYFVQRLPAHLLPPRSESPEVRGSGWSRQRQTWWAWESAGWWCGWVRNVGSLPPASAKQSRG